MDRQGPLTNLRVVDAGTTLAGPMAGTLLADLGADVIKIEHPKGGDSLRSWGPFKREESLWWKVTARNKKLITLDLSCEEGQELFRTLIGRVDVVIENFRPGTFERWSLGPVTLFALNPSLVLVRISGFGQEGPYRSQPGYGTIAEALTGIPYFTGFADAAPTFSAFPLADAVAALFAAIGALAAVSNPSARGQVVDVSLFEPLFRLVESQVIGYQQLGIVKERAGNRLAEDAPRNAYQTRDGGWIAISASSDRTFHRLCRAIGRSDLIEDERFSSNRARVRNNDELDKIIDGWMHGRSRDEAMARLEEFDVVAGPVLNIGEIFEHPLFTARDAIVSASDELLGVLAMPGVVPRFSNTPGAVRFPGGRLGRDNRNFYCDELGMSEAEFQELAARGVI